MTASGPSGEDTFDLIDDAAAALAARPRVPHRRRQMALRPLTVISCRCESRSTKSPTRTARSTSGWI